MSEAARPANASVILEERAGAVLTIRLNRPDRLNALNVELGTALAAALRRASEDHSVRCVVLTGAGRAFCGGGDVGVLRDARKRGASHELAALVSSGKEIVLLLATMPKPVLASVNGPRPAAVRISRSHVISASPQNKLASARVSPSSACIPILAARFFCRAWSAPRAPRNSFILAK